MPIKFRCQHCRQFLGISRSKAGEIFDCPTCGWTLRVPDLDGSIKPLPSPGLDMGDSKLAKALDELEPLRKGCGLYLDEIEVEEPRPMIPQQQVIQVVIAQERRAEKAAKDSSMVDGKQPSKTSPMSTDAAAKKALAIAKKRGWPISRGKASKRAMADEVGCSPSTINKALQKDASLRRYLTKAKVPARSHLSRESDELNELIAAQTKDDRSKYAM